jgi:hypothetical protein
LDPIKLANSKINITESRKGNKFNHLLPAPGIHIYDNVWLNGLDFIKSLEKQNRFKREDYIVDSNGEEIPKEVGKKGLSTWITGDLPEEDLLICSELEEVIDSYLWHYDLDPQSRECWRISKYTEGDYFGMHPDDSYGTPRTVAMVYYPNDDYEGGELEFINFNIKIKPKANQLFVFPASYVYEHKIHDIGPGNPRYTVVAFFCNITSQERQTRLINIKQPYRANLKYIKELET